MDKKLKIGIIGTGGIAGAHMAGYKALDNVECYACCDLDLEKAKNYAEKHGIPAENVFDNYDDMLALSDLDAVSVCTWNASHAPATIAALKAGKHVLCEKPMAMNAEEARAMKAAADESGKLLMIGFVRRYGNDCGVIRDFIEGGTLGDIYYAKATYLRRHGFPGGWFGDKDYSGGGPLIDLGVHVIDLSRYLMGNHKPVSVYGYTSHNLGCRPGYKSTKGGYMSTSRGGNFKYDVEDLAVAMIRFDNGATLTVEASFDLNIKDDIGNIELFGTNGGVKIDPEVEIYTDVNKYLVNITPAGSTALSFNGLFEGEIKHYVDCITNGTKCVSPAEDGIVLMEILDAIYESARTGHEVVLG